MPFWYIGQIGVVPSAHGEVVPRKYGDSKVATTRNPMHGFPGHDVQLTQPDGKLSVEENFLGSAFRDADKPGEVQYHFTLVPTGAPRLRQPIITVAPRGR